MAVIMKCKMCGGDLTLTEGAPIATCEYCGTTQTVPSMDNDKKADLFLRANKLRFDSDFDRAAGIYDSIIADFPAEAEAYWGLLLCKFGIEYVDDPATGKKIPTCHRSSFRSVMEDENLDKVMEYADVVARKIYREQAKDIEEIRRGIVEVSAREEPYDIFICYKETDETGGRTLDSVLAQDVYDALTERGYRVFFSRISLEDKLGREYEPYIFAALHSAKVMLAFGTDYEYFNAVWVKNEWSRYLQLMTQDKGKHLIPCFKGIDAYDMPREFAKLQAQDLGKVGAVQDLLRGIDKLFARGQTTSTAVAAGLKADEVNMAVTYGQAMDKSKENTVPALTDAIEKLKSIPGWQDADSRVMELEERLARLKQKKKRKRIVLLAVAAAVVILAAVGIKTYQNVRAAEYYAQALSYMEEENWNAAASRFRQAGNYKNAPQGEAMADGMVWLENLKINSSEFQSALEQDSDISGVFAYIQSEWEGYWREGSAYCIDLLTQAGDYPGAAQALAEAKEISAWMEDLVSNADELIAEAEQLQSMLSGYGAEAGYTYFHQYGAIECSTFDLMPEEFFYYGMGQPVEDIDDPACYELQVESDNQFEVTGTVGLENGELYLKDTEGNRYDLTLGENASVTVSGNGPLPNGTYINDEEFMTQVDQLYEIVDELWGASYQSPNGDLTVTFNGGEPGMNFYYLTIRGGGVNIDQEVPVIYLPERRELRFGIDRTWILVARFNDDGTVALSTIGDAPVEISGVFQP